VYIPKESKVGLISRLLAIGSLCISLLNLNDQILSTPTLSGNAGEILLIYLAFLVNNISFVLLIIFISTTARKNALSLFLPFGFMLTALCVSVIYKISYSQEILSINMKYLDAKDVQLILLWLVSFIPTIINFVLLAAIMLSIIVDPKFQKAAIACSGICFILMVYVTLYMPPVSPLGSFNDLTPNIYLHGISFFECLCGGNYATAFGVLRSLFMTVIPPILRYASFALIPLALKSKKVLSSRPYQYISTKAGTGVNENK
jgi:hypothetical protein